jgi:hypothetical protein
MQSIHTVVSDVFAELSLLKRWAGFNAQGTVVKAASVFKRLIRSSTVDPFVVCPAVDGRVRNVLEEKTQGQMTCLLCNHCCTLLVCFVACHCLCHLMRVLEMAKVQSSKQLEAAHRRK